MTEELLNELAEKLLAAYRTYLEAQRAYYGREAEVDEALEWDVVNTYKAFQHADFLHRQALALWAKFDDPDSEYVRFATKVLTEEGLIS